MSRPRDNEQPIDDKPLMSAPENNARMATWESPAARGARRSRMLRQRTGDELGTHRRSLGISLREIAHKLEVSVDRLARAERGDASALTIDLAAQYAAVVGLTLAVSLHPGGDAVRDRGHLALLERFRRRLPAGVKWRTEVPIPIAGDLRSGDAVMSTKSVDHLVEAETHLGDFQAFERRIGAKARDLGTDRMVLLLADTRHNRAMLHTIPAIREQFPIDARAWFRAIGRGEDPGGDALVIL
jgi:transcriptional regulator with XRE-family HTH domain